MTIENTQTDEQVEQPQGSTEAPVTPAPTGAEEAVVEIDGEYIPVSQLKAERMMRSTFTQKTQELAEERKQLEAERQNMAALVEIDRMWKEQPHRRTEILETLAKDVPGWTPPAMEHKTQATPPPIPVEDMLDETRMVYEASQREIGGLKAQVGMLTSTLNEVKDFIGQQRQATQMESAVLRAQAELKASGINASTEALKAAVAVTGITDPGAAFLKANLPTVASSLANKAVQNVSATKPNSVPSGGNAMDLSDPDLTADDIVRGLQDGSITIPQQ